MARQHSDMAALDEQRLEMTYEEFLAWAGEETRAEWVDGEVILLGMPNTIHQEIILYLATLLSHYASLLDLGKVMIAPYDMRLLPVRSSRQPDIIFVAREHVDRITEDRLVGAADLVIEVISPDSVTRDKRDKLLEYQQAGVPEYWIVDPRERQRVVEPFTLTERGIYRPIATDDAGRLHSIVLPGFWLNPTWLWQEPLPDPDAILMQLAGKSFMEKITALYKAIEAGASTEEDEESGV